MENHKFTKSAAVPIKLRKIGGGFDTVTREHIATYEWRYPIGTHAPLEIEVNTQPASAKPLPLTEIEIKRLMEDNNLHFGQYAVRLIRAVEEAHGIKEQP